MAINDTCYGCSNPVLTTDEVYYVSYQKKTNVINQAFCPECFKEFAGIEYENYLKQKYDECYETTEKYQLKYDFVNEVQRQIDYYKAEQNRWEKITKHE